MGAAARGAARHPQAAGPHPAASWRSFALTQCQTPLLPFSPCLPPQAGIPVLQIVFARSIILLLFSSSMLARQGRQAEWPWRSARCGGVGCSEGSLRLLPLALALLIVACYCTI